MIFILCPVCGDHWPRMGPFSHEPTGADHTCSSGCRVLYTFGEEATKRLAKRMKEDRERRKAERTEREHQRERDWQSFSRLGPP